MLDKGVFFRTIDIKLIHVKREIRESALGKQQSNRLCRYDSPMKVKISWYKCEENLNSLSLKISSPRYLSTIIKDSHCILEKLNGHQLNQVSNVNITSNKTCGHHEILNIMH